MLRLVQGDSQYTELYHLNTFALPNSSGHWLLVALLLFVSSFAATKIMVTGIFAGTIAAAGFLRYKTVGVDGVPTSMLIAAAVSFNWLWLIGFYNFCIGAAIVIFSIAVFTKWRENLTVRRMLVVGFLLLLVYLSHLVAIAALAGSLLVIAFFTSSDQRRSVMARTIVIMLPLLPFALIYRVLIVSSDISFIPTWHSLNDSTLLMGWLNHIRTADPFIIISRKAFPFVESFSNWFGLFTPGVWMAGALMLIGLATFIARRDKDLPAFIRPEYVLIFGILLTVAFFGPDDFGLQHGGLIRQRVLIIGLLLFIPVFRFGGNKLLKISGNALLLFVVVFQTMALWDYSRFSDAVGREFVSVQSVVTGSEGVASLTVIDDPLRYPAVPTSMVGNLNGIGRNQIVWDNYELGHYVFPVVLKRQEDKDFVYHLTRNSVFLTHDSKDQISEKLMEIDSAFQSDKGRIQKLLVWGKLSELDEVLVKYFDMEPLRYSENIRILQRKRVVE